MFEKYKLEDIDDGYDEWLKTNEVKTHENVNNISQLQQNFDKYKKTAIQELVVHKEIDDVCNNITCGSSNISNKRITDYSNTDIFSESLTYNDVKRAHTETFIPVTNDDYNSKKKYKNVTELNMDRGSQKMNIPSMEDSRNYLKNQIS